METWSALDWVAGIVGQPPKSMISKRDDPGNGPRSGGAGGAPAFAALAHVPAVQVF
jgi:hypothetical protein